MTDFPPLLLGSLVLRPYVFGFLALHLAGASAFLGWRRMAAYTGLTWIVAFAAEWSSIRTGIPFGWYYYVPDTAGRELWIGGVPFFDSLSFPFLLAASYAVAALLLAGPAALRGARPGRVPHLLCTALLFVLVDVVIDPVALRGDRWFLGRIYGYPEPGIYFGVPVANFVGWGVVGLLATGLYQAWASRRPAPASGPVPGRAWLCPGLYFLVLAFNLAITFAIGEWWLGLCGLALAVTVFGALAAALWAHRRAAPVWGEGIHA